MTKCMLIIQVRIHSSVWHLFVDQWFSILKMPKCCKYDSISNSSSFFHNLAYRHPNQKKKKMRTTQRHEVCPLFTFYCCFEDNMATMEPYIVIIIFASMYHCKLLVRSNKCCFTLLINEGLVTNTWYIWCFICGTMLLLKWQNPCVLMKMCKV